MCESIMEINMAAEVLNELSGLDLLTSKGMIAAMQPQDLADAMALIETRYEYALLQDISSPYDIGLSRLRSALPREELELLLPHVNLYGYGESAMKRYPLALTEYGGLDRFDGEPVLKQENDTPERGEMEMM